MRAIMLAFACEQQYHTLRAAAAAGYSVHVLGKNLAYGLKYSRYCASYHTFDFDPFSQTLDEALAEINRWVGKLSADIILPSDIISTRLLAALEGRLPAPTSALPEVDCFDMLNDKWQLYRFCRNHGVSVPQSWLFENADILKTAAAESGLPFPFIVKPVDAGGSFGVYRIKGMADLEALEGAQYKPLLAQKLITGDEIDISILADKGRIVAYAIQRNLPEEFLFIRQDALLAQASRIVAESGFHGLAHFDAIMERETGDVYIIECNPRPWMSLFAAKAAGLNFIDLSLNPAALDPDKPLCIIDKQVDNSNSTKKLLKKLLASLVKGQGINKPDLNLLAYNIADPIGKKYSNSPRFNDGRLPPTNPGSINGQTATLAALRKRGNAAVS